VFIKTVKDFDRCIKAEDRCDYCGKQLVVPPVITIEAHKYHLDCAKNLAYAIFFELAGKPDLPTK
jgi:hypothetical protein